MDAGNVAKRKRKILFVEDDENILKLYQEEFTEEGYDVILAADGDEGLTKYRLERPDVVVLDLCMPKRDGIETLNTILGMNRQAKVIICSAYPQFRHNFMTWGAEAFLLKSADMVELKRKVSDAAGNAAKSSACR